MATLNPITQRDLRVAAADVLQASPNTAAALENLRNQNIAQAIRISSSFLAGQKQAAPMSIQAIYAENDELARRRKELEDRIDGIIKSKLDSYKNIPSLLDAIIKAEQGVYGDAVGAEAQVASAATNAETQRMIAVFSEKGDVADKVFNVVADLKAEERNLMLESPQVQAAQSNLRDAGSAMAAHPTGIQQAWKDVESLAPPQQQALAVHLKTTDPELYDAVNKETGGRAEKAAADYYAANAQQVAATEKGLKAFDQLATELDLPPAMYDVVTRTNPDGTVMRDKDGQPIVVRTLKPEALRASRYLAISADKGKAARKFLDEFGWGDYVKDQYKRIHEDTDPDLKDAREQLAQLRVLSTGVDAPTTARAALRTNADIRARAQQVAEARLGLKQKALKESELPGAAKARKLSRVGRQLDALEVGQDQPIPGARAKLALQRAYRQSRRGSRLSFDDKGGFRKTTAPMSVAQQSAALGSRARVGDLAQEMQSGKTLTGGASEDFATGGKPISSAGAAAGSKLQGLGEAFLKQGAELDRQTQRAQAARETAAPPVVPSTLRASEMAGRFFDDPREGFSRAFKRTLQGKASTIRQPHFLSDVDTTDEVDED
jgi:hypothetical protein